ncbi:DUF2993 domain-containing protein [Corynebacterium sp. H127]|uniref:LmeA family phospholipid-binding protein n=1 Tax=Corynebacterium sp. H127 TaxID=3133418 RepID=UPI0030AEB657
MTTKRTGSIVWKVLVSLILLALLLLVAAEFGVRWMISDNLKKEFASTAPAAEDPSISFGPTPVLLSQLTGTIPSLDMSMPASYSVFEGKDGAPVVEGAPAADISVKDLNIKDKNNPIAGHLLVNTDIKEDYLLAQAQASMAEQAGKTGDSLASQLLSGLIKVSKIDAIEAEQAVKVEFTDGAASLTLRPTMEGDKVKFTAEKASVLGMDLPESATTAITQAFERQATEMSGQLKIEDISVSDEAVHLRFSGDDVPLSQVEGATQSGTPRS